MNVSSFPGDVWFAAMEREVAEHPDVYRHLGFADFRLVIAVEEDGHERRFGLVFDGYDVFNAGEIDDLARFRADAVVSGPADAWREMIGAIIDNGRADGTHTLNALTIADAPLRVTSSDPLGRDKFFRYAETVQMLFDALATVQPLGA